MTIFSKTFAKAAGERAIFSAANSLLAMLTIGTSLFDVDWKGALSVAATAGLVSLLKSVVVAGASDGNPSLGSSEILAQDGATGTPIGDDEQKTVVPDPTGEIAEAVQEEVELQEAPRRAATEEVLQEELPQVEDADVTPAPMAPSDVRLS